MKLDEESENVHRATAAKMFGIEESAVTAEQLRVAKMANFGALYNREMEPQSLLQVIAEEHRRDLEYLRLIKLQRITSGMLNHRPEKAGSKEGAE